MPKDTLEFIRIVSPDEAAEYLSSLGLGLKRGRVSLESGDRALHLVPASELKLDLRVKHGEEKGKLFLKIAWKAPVSVRAADLQIGARTRRPRS
jgi:amphi-Trp domain-containing protein